MTRCSMARKNYPVAGFEPRFSSSTVRRSTISSHKKGWKEKDASERMKMRWENRKDKGKKNVEKVDKISWIFRPIYWTFPGLFLNLFFQLYFPTLFYLYNPSIKITLNSITPCQFRSHSIPSRKELFLSLTVCSTYINRGCGWSHEPKQELWNDFLP